jgi:hypothetical protein
MARLDLPKKKHDLWEALDQELIPAEQEANLHQTSWKIIDAYMHGIRKFRVMDRWNAHLSLAFENSRGELDLRYEEVVRLYLAEIGRYLKMDITPVAAKRGESLGALRKSAIANAVLGSLFAKLPNERLKRRALIPFLKYGTVGLNYVETGNEQFPDMMEIVPPRQLRGFPAWVDGTENLVGDGRKRWVPLAWARQIAKARFGSKLPRQNVEQVLRAREVPWGQVPPEQLAHEVGGSGTSVAWSVQRKDVLGTDISHPDHDGEDGVRRKDGVMYVPLEEVYVHDDTQEFVSRFIVKIGEYIVHDEDFEDQGLRVVRPLHVGRHSDIGKFFARGFVAPLIPLNDQIEKMLASLFKNIAEMDMFGTLFVPGSMGIDKKRWRTGPRPKIETFEPDPINPNIQPQNLGPHNSGLLPARIAEFAGGMMSKMAGQGPLFQGETSGRIDSAAGLGFLFNTSNIALGLPANGIADAFAGCYRRMLQSAKERMQPGATVELATIDDAIAGTVIDPESGLMQLTNNPIPDPWEVRTDIKDRTPQEPNVVEQKLRELRGEGLVDDTRFWITALEKNLDIPGAPKELWETWRKVTWQIILLFRDGREPGTIEIGEHTQNPDVQLIALQQFMSKIEFSLASKQVRDEFERWKVDLEILAGRRFPEGLPPPEVAAEMQAAGAQQRPGVEQMGIPPGLSPAGPNMM